MAQLEHSRAVLTRLAQIEQGWLWGHGPELGYVCVQYSPGCQQPVNQENHLRYKETVLSM